MLKVKMTPITQHVWVAVDAFEAPRRLRDERAAGALGDVNGTGFDDSCRRGVRHEAHRLRLVFRSTRGERDEREETEKSKPGSIGGRSHHGQQRIRKTFDLIRRTLLLFSARVSFEDSPSSLRRKRALFHRSCQSHVSFAVAVAATRSSGKSASGRVSSLSTPSIEHMHFHGLR